MHYEFENDYNLVSPAHPIVLSQFTNKFGNDCATRREVYSHCT